MNLDYLRNRLATDGWQDVRPRQHLGIDFDLVGSRKFTLTPWTVLVKTLPRLDRETIGNWRASFEMLSDKSKSYLWGKCFLLCLVADEVAPDVVQAISGDAFGLLGILRLKGGGGNVLIADSRSKQVYGKVPTLPADVRKFSKSVTEILRAALAQPEATRPPTEAVEADSGATCPACGKAVREGAKFCGGCGAKLATNCEECGASLRPGAKFCGECGAPVAD